MTEEAIITSELSVTFAPDGTIGSGGGVHIRMAFEGTPTVEVIKDLLARVAEATAEREGNGQVEGEQGVAVPSRPAPAATWHQPARRPSQAPRRPAASKAEEPEIKCPKKGVYVTKKGGKYPPGFYPNWHHNDVRMATDGHWYCPTVVDLDEGGEAIWCSWESEED